MRIFLQFYLLALTSIIQHLIDSNDQNYDYLTTFKNDDIQGLENRLNVYNEQLNQSIGLKNHFSSIVKNHKVILFSLNSLDYPQSASNIGKLLIQDLKEFASIKPREQQINIILDEFNVFADNNNNKYMYIK